MAEDVYLRLRDFLDKLPGGFPTTENGVELKLLKRYFTPEEAEMELHLQLFPETAAAIAARAGMDEAAAAEMLESMAKQGSIFRLRAGDETMYMAMSFLVGIYEFHLKSMDRELAELLDEYMPYITDFWSQVKTKQMRVVPVEAAVDATKEISTYNSIRALVKGYDNIAVADCICRVERGLLGHECERPHENCLVFGFAADYYAENGIGRKISLEECLDILDKAEEAALVLSPSNAQDIVNICCCCSCCCGQLRGLTTFARPADHVHSICRAEIDPDVCTACGTCLDRCQIEAIVEGEEYMEVDPARCIGCGLCVPTCPADAVEMVLKEDLEAPPANVVEMNMRILQDRGLM
ncbi:MAG: 4Fe-4S ferredoxin [Actinobacteria bacterium]|jgi:Pyruvate/2-oxoacid:ferredoxin oxidoreductase delta subunit|nr:MAG: 4Fe-4S ferredoxin [Actinomycetota bacterium]